MKRLIPFGLLMLAGLTLIAVGCNQQANAPKAPAPVASVPGSATGDAHEHLKSAHGGKMFVFGAHQYHGEALIDKDGNLRFFTFDKDEEKVIEVAAQSVVAYARAEGMREPVSIPLRPEPQSGDAEGKTSQFVAALPKELLGKKLDVSIPNFRVGTDRFRVAFQVGDSGHVEMPGKVADAEERKLYLTPGGIYTSADIAANGSKTASQRFDGLKAEHDAEPKSGDTLCPISKTKANEKFPWIIGGKKYEFCCPPCVDEFLIRAKEKPETIQPPEAYRKK